MDATRFAGRLKELREAAGLTQKQLAEKAGMGQRTVSALEQGLSDPIWSTAIALAKALGADLRAFLEEPSGPPADPKRGRPPKAPAAPPADEAPKRPRG